MMSNELPENVFFEYFSGKATLLQHTMIKDWLRADENKEFFMEMLEKWEKENPQYQPDLEIALASYDSFLEHNVAEVRPLAVEGSERKPALKIWITAASVLLILGGGFAFLKDTILHHTYATQYGEKKTLVLPDGSRVTLNSHSSLKLERNFAQAGKREVWLAGEAFFSVAKNNRKFIVHTGKLDVEVLGTQFNVNSYRSQTEVALKEGSVKLISYANAQPDSLLMKPGEQVTVDAGKKLSKKPMAAIAASWLRDELVFEDAPLAQVAQRIEDYYGVEIKIKNPALSARTFRGTLPDNDLDIILQTLARLYKIEVSRQGNSIVLR